MSPSTASESGPGSGRSGGTPASAVAGAVGPRTGGSPAGTAGCSSVVSYHALSVAGALAGRYRPVKVLGRADVVRVADAVTHHPQAVELSLSQLAPVERPRRIRGHHLISLCSGRVQRGSVRRRGIMKAHRYVTTSAARSVQCRLIRLPVLTFTTSHSLSAFTRSSPHRP